MEKDNRIFKNYIFINEDLDNNPNNLLIDYIHNSKYVANLINKLIYEVHKDKLNNNDNNTRVGVRGFYPVNEYTDWSILNFFGGHKFVKERLINLFKSEKPQQTTPREFYLWLINNKEKLFNEGKILKQLVKSNMATFNKGTKTETYVIGKLKNAGFDVKYYPLGSNSDINEGIDISVNNVTYQIKEWVGHKNIGDSVLLKTPIPKNYLDKKVNRIMLVNTDKGEYISFKNDQYIINNEGYIINKTNKTVKRGHYNAIHNK
jgi:hypothetical protein